MFRMPPRRFLWNVESWFQNLLFRGETRAQQNHQCCRLPVWLPYGSRAFGLYAPSVPRGCCKGSGAGSRCGPGSRRVTISAVSSRPDAARIFATGTRTAICRDATGTDRAAVVDRRAERWLASTRSMRPRFPSILVTWVAYSGGKEAGQGPASACPI